MRPSETNEGETTERESCCFIVSLMIHFEFGFRIVSLMIHFECGFLIVSLVIHSEVVFRFVILMIQSRVWFCSVALMVLILFLFLKLKARPSKNEQCLCFVFFSKAPPIKNKKTFRFCVVHWPGLPKTNNKLCLCVFQWSYNYNVGGRAKGRLDTNYSKIK